MNCKQFNSIKLEEVLVSLGHHPTKQNEKEAWYLNPFSTENQASFKLNKRSNVWYLHSQGIGGANIDFMTKYLNSSVKEVLEWAEKQNFSSFQQQENNFINSNKTNEKNYRILKVEDEISHLSLIQYLQKRRVLKHKIFLKEIHYQVKNKDGIWKKFFAVGFPNKHENSFEISSPFWKGCLGKKDVVLIKNNSKTLKVTESFFDFLSLKIIEENLESVANSDYLILNSTALFSKVERDFQLYNSYERIELFLDNDRTGKETTQKFLSLFSQAEEHSFLYRNYKDLNDFLCGIKTA